MGGAAASLVLLLGACSGAGNTPAGPSSSPTDRTTDGATDGATGATNEPSPGGETSPGPTDDGTDPSPTASPVPEGSVGSPGCALTEEQLGFVLRDWARVSDSVGRGDHGDYTAALVRRLGDIRADAEGCRGATQLDRFEALVRRIDARAAAGAEPPYGAYEVAQTRGDAWLRRLGLGPKALSRF